ncbi:MAG TPA: PepSY domain-containing protein [Gemmatimonadales bacterium]|nr:PepSY domain-containing protein [Gemmatimonadales bacterium]
MTRLLIPAAILAVGCAPKPAAAPPEHPAATAPTPVVTLSTCVAAVQAAHAGVMVKVEGKTESGRETYEFDVRSPDKTEWDVECDALSGKVIEVEQEVASASDEPFKGKVKVSEADARKTALAAHPGVIAEVEYEVEADGSASYEFDINPTGGGTQIKVEVDATSGKIVEDYPENWQIGVE